MSIFGQLLCSAADERSICCVREGFWMSVNGERGVGYCEGWQTVCAQTHSTGSPAIPLACVPGIHHKYFSNIIPQPCPNHAPVILPSEGETFSFLCLSLSLWCLVNNFSCCKCQCIYFSMSCIIRYNKNNLKNLTSAMYNLMLHFKARLFTISRQCCQRVFLYACLLWNWQNCQEWKQRTFLLSCDAH